MSKPVEQQPGGSIRSSEIGLLHSRDREALLTVKHTSSVFSWTVRIRESTTTLKLSGELDIAAAESTREDIVKKLDRSRGPVVVDTARLEFLDSSGLRLLLDLKSRLEGTGRTLTLSSISPAVARLLDISGLGSVFEEGAGEDLMAPQT